MGDLFLCHFKIYCMLFQDLYMDGLYAMIFHIVCHFMSQEKDVSYGLWILLSMDCHFTAVGSDVPYALAPV